MSKEALKKALLRGIPMGICLAVAYVVFHMLMSGGSFFGHLFSIYGILTLICVPIAWVFYYYEKEKQGKK